MFNGRCTHGAAEEFFGIDSGMSHYIFMPSAYHFGKPTTADVSARIRECVAAARQENV